MENVMQRLHAAIEKRHKKHPKLQQQQIKTAFAVVENGSDAFDYIIEIFLSEKENDNLTKISADNLRKWHREADPRYGYSVIDISDHLCRYYWEQGEPFNIDSK